MGRRQKGRGDQLPKAQSTMTWVSSWSNGEPQNLSRGHAMSEMCPRKLLTDWTGETMEAGRLGWWWWGTGLRTQHKLGPEKGARQALPNKEGRAR